jgi:hypothetical protein
VIAGWNVAAVPSNCLTQLDERAEQQQSSTGEPEVQRQRLRLGRIRAVAAWKYIDDPHGSAIVLDPYFPYGGHLDTGPLGQNNRRREPRVGLGTGMPIANYLNLPMMNMTDSPTFAGIAGFGYGNSTNKHPSYRQDVAQTTPTQQLWFDDQVSFSGPTTSLPPGLLCRGGNFSGVSVQHLAHRAGSHSAQPEVRGDVSIDWR